MTYEVLAKIDDAKISLYPEFDGFSKNLFLNFQHEGDQSSHINLPINNIDTLWTIMEVAGARTFKGLLGKPVRLVWNEKPKMSLSVYIEEIQSVFFGDKKEKFYRIPYEDR